MMCDIMTGHYCSSSYFEQYFYLSTVFWLLYLLPPVCWWFTWGKEAMFLKQLHDQGPALVQSSTQRRAGDPVQIPEKILSFCTRLNKECIASLSIHLLEQFCSYCAWCYLSYLPCRRWRCLHHTWRRSWGCWAPSCSWRDDGSSSSGSWGLLLSPPTLDTWHVKDEEREYGGKGE